MASNWCTAGELISYSAGGGWGKENADNDYVCRVAVIRGADFPLIDKGKYQGLPIRWEKFQKAMNSSLQEGDIVIEISGGTESRPTGRTILITKELLEAYDCPVIPASFCRLIRSKKTVNSVYFYYWLQEMYRAGRTWGYQNRSTGLSNFQYKTFCNMESVFIPEVDTQRKIASSLLSFDKKRRLLTQLNDYLSELLDTEFNNLILHKSSDWSSASLLDIANYKNGLAMQKFRPIENDPGLPVVKIRELGQGYCGSDAERCRSDIDETVRLHDGDLVFSWSGTLLLDFWADGDAGLNQHLFKVTSDRYPSWFYYSWTKCHMRHFVSMAKDRATTMGHIKRSALQDSEVFIPRHDEMQILTTRMQPLVNELINLKVESRKLAEYRDALLPRLMSGEIDVSRIELPTRLNNHLSADSVGLMS